MTNEQKFIVSLIRKSFNLETAEQIDYPIDEEAAIQIIRRNGILLTVYPTLCFSQNTSSLKNKLEYEYFIAIRTSVNQKYEAEQVLDTLNRNGFNCIALKGWEIRDFYPSPSMRQMADVDILVSPYKYDAIKELMRKMDFSYGRESTWKHDSFIKGLVHIEMHKRLTDDSSLIKQWEAEMWNRAIPYNHHIYKMSIEDFCLFHFIHLHKDFLNGSLGLRRIIDTWILSKQPKNEEFINEELRKFGLITFYNRMIILSNVLMGEKETDENSEILLNHAFAIGIFGNGKSYKTGRIVAMSKNGNLISGKIRSWVSAVFLPIDRMKAQYPILEKWPILLPYCWLKRCIHFLFGNMKKNRNMLDYRNIGNEEYQEMKAFFKAGGEL